MKRLLALILMMILLSACGLALAEGNASLGVVDENARALQYGDTGEDVLALQTRLKELCYYTGPLSGQFAEVTRSAVKAVQADYGLSQTGVADAQTLSVIYGECYRTLKRGMSGDDVTALQQRLLTLGYYSDKVSGNFLNNTQKAVLAFQSASGLAATGTADAQTLKALYAQAAVTPSPTPTPTPTPPATPSPTPNVSFPGKLQRGSTGARVKQLQERLAELGFFEGKTTVNYQAKTQQAVKDFQAHNGLKADGVVGEDTWNALYAADVVPANATPKPTPEPTPVPYFIEVDVNNQVTKVFTRDENGAFTVLHKAFICSTGTKGYPSDVGTWTLNGRRALWAQFPKWGGGTAQYWTRINANIAFHSVIYRDYDDQQLVESSYKALGSRASHGCIRLTVADAKWIYTNCRAGVEVWIHEDSPSDPELKYSLKPGSINPDTKRNYVTPTPSPAPAYNSFTPPETARQMVEGSKGEDVYWMQMRLKELGYYTGTVTGEYRAGTAKAVKAYQRANGLDADGVAGRRTLNKLYGDAASQPTPTPTPTLTPSPTPATAAPSTLTPPTETAAPTDAPADFTVTGDGTVG